MSGQTVEQGAAEAAAAHGAHEPEWRESKQARGDAHTRMPAACQPRLACMLSSAAPESESIHRLAKKRPTSQPICAPRLQSAKKAPGEPIAFSRTSSGEYCCRMEQYPICGRGQGGGLSSNQLLGGGRASASDGLSTDNKHVQHAHVGAAPSPASTTHLHLKLLIRLPADVQPGDADPEQWAPASGGGRQCKTWVQSCDCCLVLSRDRRRHTFVPIDSKALAARFQVGMQPALPGIHPCGLAHRWQCAETRLKAAPRGAGSNKRTSQRQCCQRRRARLSPGYASGSDAVVALQPERGRRPRAPGSGRSCRPGQERGCVQCARSFFRAK